MTETADTGRRTPWHFWVVAVLALLWNGFGAYDYLMTNTEGDAYMRSMGMTDAQIAYIHAMPAWMTGAWAVGVWGATLGSVLLLLRSRWAFHAFVVSLLGLLATLLYTHLLSNGGELMGTQGLATNAVITAAIVFFIWYSRLMTRRGVLR